VIGALARPFINFPKAKFVGKAELFKPPFGWFFKMMGGYPVDRSRANNLVDAIVQIYNEKDEFYITITPEGTRKYTGKLRSGFWHIANGANIPVISAGFDYPSKTVVINEPHYLSGDMEQDMQKFMDDFSRIRGKNPEDGLP
jgi:1-acyl-sn-glycerol-3-phosphate acyltransferase